jgi:protein tyrosine phosphatase (PTP) superfamily phosphohydrolase (DUF442 family)
MALLLALGLLLPTTVGQTRIVAPIGAIVSSLSNNRDSVANDNAGNLHSKTEAAIPNFRLVKGNLYCGGVPDSESDFRALARCGIQTLVSVDGIRPNVEMAKRFGLRYVHIPFGYDDIPEPARRSLVRVARDIQGSVYVHCHHGVQRAPAAAAIVALTSGDFDSTKDAIALLKRAGTSPEYPGLWHAVRDFRVPAEQVRLPKLVAVADPGDLASSMALINQSLELLEAFHSNPKNTSASHPDFVAEQQALLIREMLHESGRQTGPEEQGRGFHKALGACERRVKQLEAALATSNESLIKSRFKAVRESCVACHQTYRNGM